jgi:hypothetical protein
MIKRNCKFALQKIRSKSHKTHATINIWETKLMCTNSFDRDPILDVYCTTANPVARVKTLPPGKKQNHP